MQNQVLFNRKIMQNFDFQGEYIGYVIDNSEFEETLKIKVFIPELFGYNYSVGIPKESKEISISKDHILNSEDININLKIKQNEFIYSRIIIERQCLSSKDYFIYCCKPDIGDKVIVSFFNGNPSNCVYSNNILLSEGERIEVKNEISNANGGKIVNIIKDNLPNRSTIDKIMI